MTTKQESVDWPATREKPVHAQAAQTGVPVIETYNLTKRFEDFLAVDQITLSVGAGEVLALLGPNGAGKTTTIRMLTSGLRPTSGWARVAGYDVVRQGREVRASVGLLTEQSGLYWRMNAADYLDFFGQLYDLGTPIRQKRIRELLDRFDLSQAGNRRIGDYSKGMSQKLALARAMLHEPQVLLLDEPTSAMDPESAHLVRDSIQAMRSAERSIVLSTHNLAEAEEIADQIAIIRRGRIIARGSPSALKAKFLGPSEYEVRLAGGFSGAPPILPYGVELASWGPDWIRYQSWDPPKHNPAILSTLLNQNLQVISLQEVPRSLEQVYLSAVAAQLQSEVPHVG